MAAAAGSSAAAAMRSVSKVSSASIPLSAARPRRDLVEGVEEGLLVLLEVPVVGQGQALQRGQQAGQVADEAARLAPGQLGHVGVLLLRHHRAAGGVGVREAAEAELLAAPQHQLLADAGQVHAEQGEREEGLGHEVPVAHGVEGVVEGGGEAEVGGHPGRVEGQRRARQRAGTQGRHVEPSTAVEQPVDVAGQGPAVGQQVVGEQDGLGPLQVGVAGQVGRRRPRRPARPARPGGRGPGPRPRPAPAW